MSGVESGTEVSRLIEYAMMTIAKNSFAMLACKMLQSNKIAEAGAWRVAIINACLILLAMCSHHQLDSQVS